MDTLAAYLANVAHISKALDRERVAANGRVWRESFGHPSHRDTLHAHQRRVDAFYGHDQPQVIAGTDAQIQELVDAVSGYRPAKRYKPKRSAISSERQLQIAVEAANRKAS